MKLTFDKKENGEVFVQVDGKNFATKDYIEMVKEIKKDGKIEAEFTDKITQDERTTVEGMLGEINSINEDDSNDGKESDGMDF